MTWVAVGAAAVTVVGGAISADQQAGAAKDAANASSRASQLSTAEQRRQYDQTRADQMPWLNAGGWALGQQQAFLKGDTSGFEDSAQYKFALDQGFKGLDRGAAARGGLLSGGADADRIRLGQGLATQFADNYYSKLSGLSGTGQQTASGLGSLGANMAGQIGQYNFANADAQRQSAYGQANAWSNYGNQLAGGFGQWYGGLGQDSQGRYLGNQRGPG